PGAIDGRELARRALALRPGLGVLFTSGYGKDAISRDGRLDEDAALLSKPYGEEELARKVHEAIARRVMSRPVPGRPLRLLVVEDDGLLRLSTIDMLTDLGQRAKPAATSQAALEILDRTPDLDAALVDVGLPGMRGDELVAEIRRRRPGLGVILTTGYQAAALRFDLRSLDNVVFIGK